MANRGSLLVFALFALIGCITSSSIDKECAQGIPYWCEHVMNAKKCHAVDFCIQTVWEKHNVRKDNNPLCDDCKDWVKQARDLIDNKQNSDEIIKYLELSCQLCPDENGRSKCKQIIEENVHEIFKLLDSAMNPDAVCSAIHLCNNPTFTEMFLHPKQEVKNGHLMPFTCGQCSMIGSYLEKKFKALNHDEALEGALVFCGETSSFSDSCSNIMLKNFDDIYSQLHNKITRQNLCRTTCAGLNQYSEEIADNEHAFDNADVPCKLCEQLMLHLRELLIANTSEIEFKNVLQGFCTQIPKITDECISITEEYYQEIYQFLESGLDANKTCAMIGICKAERSYRPPSMPLLSGEAFPPLYNENSINLREDGKMCIFCEYAMEFIHKEMAKNTVEDKIVEYARKSCKTLPRYVKQCEAVMDQFGDEIASLLYHGTDPRLVCPFAKLCPPNLDLTTLEVNAVGEKPTCSFCLLALQEIKDVVQSNNTRDNVEKALDRLCDHLSENLKGQCVSFVKSHSADVIDMVLANFTPQEACVFLKLCNKEEPLRKRVNIVAISSSSESSEDSSSSESKLVANPQCELCKELVKILEQRVINIKSKDEIRRKLEESCSHLRKFSKECKTFVDKYSDRIVELVSQELEPAQVCRDLIFCVTQKQIDYQDYDAGLDIIHMALISDEDEVEVDDTSSEIAEKSNPGCVLCEFVIQKIEDDLNDKKTDEDIKKTVKNICSKMPSTISKQCTQFVDYYFDMIIAVIETSPPSEVCKKMDLCSSTLEEKFQEIKNDLYSCAVCRGVVESIDTIIEDPSVDTNLENLEEKICEKFAGKFKNKCRNLASTYGVAIINILKNITESDQICFKFGLCPLNNGGQVMLN